MDVKALMATAAAMVAGDRGILAMDESTPTCDKRFAQYHIPMTIEYRQAYREMIVTTPKLGECISGAILFDETIRQSTRGGMPFVEALKLANIIPGIKVDGGTKDHPGFPGEKITEGLDGLGARLKEYYGLGARFAKWRAVITIGEGLPSRGNVEAHASALARYAALCQEGGLVPIVEPEILLDGDHDLDRSFAVSRDVWRTVFDQLLLQRVDLRCMILKPGMVLPGKDCPDQSSVEAVAEATVRALLDTVPASVPGIAFLSGGQSDELASARLSAMNAKYRGHVPWALAFSYARAIQAPALKIWSGQEANVAAAQKALYHRANCNKAARRGEYSSAMEGK